MNGTTFKGQPFQVDVEAPQKEGDYPKTNTQDTTRLMSSSFNEQTSGRHYANEVRFSFYNHATLVKAFEKGRAIDLTELPKQKDKGALIIGSGPTLDEALPRLKDWQGEIICSTSQAPTLVRWGRDPDHIVALDPDSHPGELAVPDGWTGRKSILHVHPGVNPGLISWWPGRFAVFRKLQPQTAFYANEQAIGYGTLGPKEGPRYDGNQGEPYIKSQVPMLACVLAAQICIAKHLGYFQQYLVGADSSFPGDKFRFTASVWNGTEWVDDPPAPLSSYAGPPDPVVETEFDGLKSTPMFIFYGHQIVIAWRITETNVINTSNKGLLRMFPYVPLEEVFRHQKNGVKGYNLRRIREVAEEHLAKQNVYFLWVGKGVMPHEFKDPLHEIPKLMAQLEHVMKAQGRAKEFDAEANRRRIERLFKKVAQRAGYSSTQAMRDKIDGALAAVKRTTEAIIKGK